jgi:hypothetical protein
MSNLQQAKAKTLKQIVDDEDKYALEIFCIRHVTYEELITIAKREGVDLDALEELLGRI